MSVNNEKVKNMILFFVSKINNITSIKLQKAMLLADRMYWACCKESISGLEYVKAQYGPVMESEGKKILSEMDNTILKVTYSTNDREYNSKTRTTNTSPDMSVFSTKEIDLLEDVCNIIKGHSEKELVNMTHDEAWEKAEIGEILPYQSCIYEEVIDKKIDLSKDEKALALKAIKEENYVTLEALASTWR